MAARGETPLGNARHYGPGSVNFGPIFWNEVSEVRERALATTDFTLYTSILAELSKLQRDKWMMIPTFIHPVYYGVNKGPDRQLAHGWHKKEPLHGVHQGDGCGQTSTVGRA